MSSTTGEKNPTAVVGVVSAGTDWSSPANAKTNNGSYATAVNVPAGNNYADILYGDDFDFAVPSTARILGIEAHFEAKASINQAMVNDVFALTLDGVNIRGDNKSSITKFSTSDSVRTGGSSSDLWSTTWTPAQINDPAFGILLRFANTHETDTCTFSVDYMSLEITYELTWGGKILETITNPGEVLEKDSNGIHSIMGVVAGATGYSLGGYTSASINTIQDLDFPSETAATITATLDAATYGGAGVNSSRKGYNMGGYTTANTAVIDDLFFIAETSQAIAGTLNTAKRSGAGCSAPLKGFIFGGYTSVNVAVIEDITFSTEASVAIAATLDTAMRGNAGAYSNIKGYSLGGRNADGDYVTIIEDITYSSEASAALAATLDAARGWGTGVSSRYKGYVMSGIGAANTAVIEDLVFADETSQAIVATLDTAKYGGTGVQFVVKGYCMSGYTTENTNVIEDLVFPTETSAAISDTVTTANIYAAGVSFG